MNEGWIIVAVFIVYLFLLLYCLRFIVKCLAGGDIGPALLVVVGIGLSAAFTVHVIKQHLPDDLMVMQAPPMRCGQLPWKSWRARSSRRTSASMSRRAIGQCRR